MHGKLKRFKKLYAVLMLVSFVFASVSPAFAVGIFEGKIFSEVGDKTDFAGYNWMLFKKDDKSGYIITTEGIGSSVFRNGISDANLYYSSVLRGKVNDYEKEMKSYTGPQLTWAEVNGTADGKNYIEKHDMSDCANMRPRQYDDLLYILSVVEAEVLPANILRLGRDKDWWLRSKGSMGPLRVATIHHDVWGNPYVDYPGCEISDTLLVRPALQINLQSPIFAQTAFKTAPTGGKADVKVGDGFTLKDYDGSGGWKLTETDRSIPVPNATLTALAHWTIAIGNIVTVKYSGVKTGENMYLSALLYDNNGNLINYAKVADTSTNGSGEAQLSFKNLSLPSWNCKVAFVSEQVSGDDKPDRFSAPTAMYNVILTSNDGLEGRALLLPDSELPEQLKIKDEIKQTLPVPVLSPEQITGVSGLTEAVSKTRLAMNVEQSGGAEDKQTAKFKIMLGNKIKDYNKNKRLAVLLPDKAEQVADGSGAKIGLADGGTLELTKYTAFKAEYEEDGDYGVISFSVPEYGKYFQSGETEIIVAELNEDAKFAGTSEVAADKLPKSITGVGVIQRNIDVTAPKAENITEGVSGITEIKKCLTTLEMTVKHEGGTEDKDTAEFAITLADEITPDENSTLAALLPCKDNPEKYAAFRAKYDKTTKVLTFSVPEYGKYFSTSSVKIVELNGDAKFDGEKSSSSGCNAGFGAFALLGVLGLFYRKKK